MKGSRLVLRYIGHTVRAAALPHVPPVDDALENLAPGREFEIPARGIVIGRYPPAVSLPPLFRIAPRVSSPRSVASTR